MRAFRGSSSRAQRIAALGSVAALALLVAGAAYAARSSEGIGPHDPYAALRDSPCNPAVVPAGQADPSTEPEPVRPIWCYRLAPMPTTRVTSDNSWVDDFDTDTPMGRLDNGDMDYRIFNDIEHDGRRTTLMFVNQNHWMVDLASGVNGGAMLRPDRSFAFERDTLVVEVDVAASIAEYGDSASVEVDITTAPAPTGKIVDRQYGYGLFGGHWTFGCRFQPDRDMTCSLFDPSEKPGEAAAFGNERGRVWQMLPFQHVGAHHAGGSAHGENAHFFRACAENEMDVLCRDRFRLELARDSVRVFVNGHLYFEQSGLSEQHQLPRAFLDAPVYVYFVNWTNRPLAEVYRVHWDRIAVNPPDAGAAPLSRSPSFSD